MADKTTFTPDEWKQITESVMMASMAVTAADPSGLWGLLKESFAGGSALVQAKSDASANSLVKAVADDFATSDGQKRVREGVQQKLSGKKPAEVKAASIDALRQVSGLLDTKAPADAAAFKSWLRQISQRVADAANEGGGLLGFGGVPVSEAEKATLSEISGALKLAA